MNQAQTRAANIQARYREKLARLIASNRIMGRYTKEHAMDLTQRKILSPESRAWIDSMMELYLK